MGVLRRAALTLAVLVLVAVKIGPVSGASSSRAGTSDPSRIAFGLPGVPSGEPVDNDFGMTLNADELRRLERDEDLVERAKVLASMLDKVPDEFGGLWFDRTEETLVVRLANPSDSTRSLIETFDYGGPISVRDAEHTLHDLQLVQADLERRVSAGSLNVDDLATFGVDVKQNRVVVEILPAAKAATRQELAAYGDLVNVTQGERPQTEGCTGRSNCYPPLKAGLDIWRASDGGACSSGFVYQDASHSTGGFKGKVLTTAGHCATQQGQVGATWRHGIPAANIGTVFLNAYVSGTEADVMFIDISDSWGSNDVFQYWAQPPGAASIANITARGCANEIAGAGCEVVGESVCYAGRSTGFHCGTLSQINVSAVDTAGILKLHNRTVSPNTSSGGDSGAPAYRTSKAKGHLWGGTQYVWLYSHIWYVQELCSWSTSCRVQIVN